MDLRIYSVILETVGMLRSEMEMIGKRDPDLENQMRRAAARSPLIGILGGEFGQASGGELGAWEEEAAGADGQHDVISHVSAPKLDALLVYGPAM